MTVKSCSGPTPQGLRDDLHGVLTSRNPRGSGVDPAARAAGAVPAQARASA